MTDAPPRSACPVTAPLSLPEPGQPASHRWLEDPQDLMSGEDFIRDILDRYGDRLFTYVRRWSGGDYQRAEDLLQEVLVRAWLKAGTIRARRALETWLFRVARNLSIDDLRARSVRPAGVAPVALEEIRVGSSEDRILDSCVVAQALSGLRPSHLEIIVEIYYRGSSFREAARILGIPDGLAAKRVHDALQHLRKALVE